MEVQAQEMQCHEQEMVQSFIHRLQFDLCIDLYTTANIIKPVQSGLSQISNHIQCFRKSYFPLQLLNTVYFQISSSIQQHRFAYRFVSQLTCEYSSINWNRQNVFSTHSRMSFYAIKIDLNRSATRTSAGRKNQVKFVRMSKFQRFY